MKLLRIVCTFLIVLCGLVTLSYADNNQMIICTDTNLYNVLCNYFGDSKIIKKDSEKLIIEVSKDTINSVTELDLSSKNIKDLKGLEVFTNLVSLRVTDNQISSLSPIRNINIQYLYANKNNISDLSSLIPDPKSLEEGEEILLTILDLSNNKLADISSVTTFIHLQTLNLNSNQISNISAIPSLEELNSLYLSDNNVSDVNVLAEMESLKLLNLQNNKLTKIDALKSENSESNLESLNLRNNRLTDIEFLNGLNRLNALDLSYNQIVKVPEFVANWINNKKIADLKLNNQTLNLVSQDNSVDFGKHSSYTNLLYFGYFFKSDLKIVLENGKLDAEKLMYSIVDLNKSGKITIDDGVFKGSVIRIDYGGSTGIETAPNEGNDIDKKPTSNEIVGDTNQSNNDANNVTTDSKEENNVVADNKNENKNTSTTDANVQNSTTNEDPTTATGKMPYTGIASKIIIVATFVSAIVIGIYTFSKNKK